jgi:hypothetical protein
MNHIFLIIVALLFSCSVSQAQFRGREPVKQNVSDNIVQQSGPSILGFIDLNKFSMQHSFSMSYNNFGEQSLGLTSYTNSIRYQIAKPLSLRADISMQYSPFNSLPQAFKNDLNKVFLERAQLDYSPSDDLRISLQYRNYNSGYYRGYHPGSFIGGMNPMFEAPFYDD